MRYAQSRFSLKSEDLRQHPKELEILLGCDGSFEAFDVAMRENHVLCAIALRNAYKKIGRDVRNVENTEEFGELIEMFRGRIGSTLKDVKTFLKGLYPFEVEAARPERIDESRAAAIRSIESEYGSILEGWGEEPSYALDDTVMRKSFKSRGPSSNKYLTTYFDSARVALVNKKLKKAVNKLSYRKKKNWKSFKEEMQELIVASLDDSHGNIAKQRFFADNCFFQFNGTEAFMLLRRNFMKKGDKVLATHEEYGENIEDMEDSGIRVTQLSEFSDESSFVSEFEKQLEIIKPEYILISSVGRFGNVYPLETINEIRKRVSPETKLIVDTCQSAGRSKHDMNGCEADFVIMSTTKGADLGQGLGVLVVAGAAPHRESKDLNGTAPPENLARTAYALNPEAMELDRMKLKPKHRKLILTPEERGQAVNVLAKKFLGLSAAVSSKNGNRIEIINPKNTDEPAHAIEFKVQGMSRPDLCIYFAQYGIYVDPGYMDATDDETVRVAFHPYMNDDAIKILCGALESCLRQNPL